MKDTARMNKYFIPIIQIPTFLINEKNKIDKQIINASMYFR